MSFTWFIVFFKSYSALTVDDEKRQIGNLISGFIKKVDYGRDFEQQLSFYVEARSAFPNLDSVHAQLVQVKKEFLFFVCVCVCVLGGEGIVR
jgi:hypothetical protein